MYNYPHVYTAPSPTMYNKYKHYTLLFEYPISYLSEQTKK